MARDRFRLWRPPWMTVVIFGILGAALSAQVNLQRHLAATPRVDEARLEQITGLYQAERAENERLQEKLTSLQQDVEQLRGRSGGERLEQAERRLDLLDRFAGLSSVQGPGIQVVINDATLPVQSEFDQNPYTVHDQDLLLVVNELWAAGAEAIEVNGQRLAADSEVRCSGPVININGIGLTPPYRLIAIGDPETLSGALANLRGGIVDQLRNVGIEVKITKERNVIVRGLAREPSFRFARPVRVDPASAPSGS